jgi:membrane-associated phospholipid phosphatase
MSFFLKMIFRIHTMNKSIKNKIRHFDEKVSLALKNISGIKIIYFLSFSGNFFFVLIFIFILFIFQNFKRYSLILLLSLIINTIIVFFLKYFFRRMRGNDNSFFIKKFDPYSFPSGHISRLSGFLVCSIYEPLFIIYFVIALFSAAVFRIGKAYHYASDCLAGFIIGVFGGFFALYIAGKYLSKIIDYISSWNI